jgi:hypothetical protein
LEILEGHPESTTHQFDTANFEKMQSDTKIPRVISWQKQPRKINLMQADGGLAAYSSVVLAHLYHLSPFGILENCSRVLFAILMYSPEFDATEPSFGIRPSPFFDQE